MNPLEFPCYFKLLVKFFTWINVNFGIPDLENRVEEIN